MSWHQQARRPMRFVLSRTIVTMIGALTLIILGEASRATAQQAPPDLRMLLNLDLFSAPPQAAGGGQPTAPSMLDQIRTLNSMGYLAGSDAVPETEPDGTEASPPGDPEYPPNQPSDAGGGSPE